MQEVSTDELCPLSQLTNLYQLDLPGPVNRCGKILREVDIYTSKGLMKKEFEGMVSVQGCIKAW